MRWSTYDSSYYKQQREIKSKWWYNRFAFLPTTIDDVVVWLEFYEKRWDYNTGYVYVRLSGSNQDIGYKIL